MRYVRFTMELSCQWFKAIEANNVQLVEELIKNGQDPNMAIQVRRPNVAISPNMAITVRLSNMV